MSAATATPATFQKVSWREARRIFISGKDTEMGFFRKVMQFLSMILKRLGFFAGFVSILDEPLDFVPGVDAVTIADDIFWVYLVYAAVRIVMIHWQENHPKYM